MLLLLHMFKYHWKNKEANFGKPVKLQVKGGTHITFELMLMYQNKYIALRRDNIPQHEPKSNNKQKLYFCHGLIRYGESVEKCIQRIIREQTGVAVKSFRVVYIDSQVQKKDGQWAITPHAFVHLKNKPTPGVYGNKISEVIEFTKHKVPKDFAFWSSKELLEFINEFDI